MSVASVGGDKAKIGKGKNAWAGGNLENFEAIKQFRRGVAAEEGVKRRDHQQKEA